MHLAVKKHNLKRSRKCTGTCVDDKSISALGAETSKTMQQCYDCGRREGTMIRIMLLLNSTGSVVGIAWVTVWWCVVRGGHADGGDSFPSDICTPSHPKHGILIFSVSKNLL